MYMNSSKSSIQIAYKKVPEERSWGLSHPTMCGVLSCTTKNERKKRGMSHSCLAIYIKTRILRQKKNYGNSNILPCKNIIFKKKSSKRNQNPSIYYNYI
jgi:hypothetical protein